MDMTPRLVVHAEMRVQRGTATHCACGGELIRITKWGAPDVHWGCRDCRREYE